MSPATPPQTPPPSPPAQTLPAKDAPTATAVFTTIANTPPIAALDMNIGASKPPEVPDPSEITSANALKTAIKISNFSVEIVVQNIRNRVVAHAQHARHKKSDNPQSQRADRRMPQIVTGSRSN